MGLDGDSQADVVYCTKTLFRPNRFIYFFSDPPHLLKTARNCLLNSGSGVCSRYMWNNDNYLIWRHICDLYNMDLETGLKLVPKLSNEHIHLSSYSKMKVKLAVQVLSDTVASVLENVCRPECSWTAEYCKKLDSFFDCLNVRSLEEYKNKRKPFLEPYKVISDKRIEWLLTDFLDYFKEWQVSISRREGPFTKEDKARMFISWQTYVSLKTTTHSVAECMTYLLQSGMPYSSYREIQSGQC